MARSISFDIAAADKASRALEAVAREVTDLERKLDGAGGTIKVDADTGKAREQIAAVDAQLARLNAKSLKIDADVAAAKRDLQVLEAEAKRATGDRKVKVDADIAAAQAKLRALEAQRVSVDVETGAAQAKLRAIESALSRVDGDKATARVDVDAGGALARLAELGSQLRNIQTPVVIPVAIGGGLEVLSWLQSVAGGLAAVGAAGVVAGGITAGALRGIKDAVGALGEADTKVSGGMRSNAGAVASAVHQVELAQRAHKQAIADVGEAQYDAARAAEAVQRAQQGVADAEQKATDATRSLEQAQQDAERATAAVADAYKAAERNLRDLDLASKGMALSQESASLAVEEAQARLVELMTDDKATDLQRRRADLAVREAKQRVEDLAASADDLAERRKTADEKGVSGSDEVRGALERQSQAQRGVEQAGRDVVEAQRAISEAQRGVTEAQHAHEQALAKVQEAEQAVRDRAWDVQAAQRAVQEASKSAGVAGSAAADAQREAFEKLTPQAQRFVLFLRDLVDGPLKDLQDTAQAGVLPGLQSGIEGFIGELGDAETRVGNIAQRVGDFFEEVGPAAGRAADAVLRLADIGSEASFDGIAGGLTKALDAFSDWANSQSADDVQADLDDVVRKLEWLWTTGERTFRSLQLAWDVLKFPVEVILKPLDAFRDLYDGIRNIIAVIPGVKTTLPDLSEEFDRLEGSTRATDGTTRDLDRSSRDLAGAQRDLESATRNAKDEMLRGEEAGIRYEGALDRAKDAAKRNGEAWSISTDKGRDNRQALLDLVQASGDYLTSLQNQGASVDTVKQKYQEQRQNLIDVAVQMGLSKTQAQNYIDKLLQVPSERKTRFEADTSQADVNVQNLINRIAMVNGKSVTISVNASAANVREDRVTRAHGGWIPGAASDIDSVSLLAAPGEFVINSRSAAEYGPLLEAINRGQDVGVALAGFGGGSGIPAARGGSGGGGSVVLQFSNLIVGGEDAVARGVAQGLGVAKARGYLPSSFQLTAAS